MTALYFEHLRAPDRVSVKPHASPVLHAIEYLLGQLDARYLTTLREFGGLQSYPSRLKDPVPADFSTGSVGHRRDGADLERARAPLRRRALRRAAGRPAGGAARRRRARRGRDLGGARRPGGPAPGRGAVGRRPQPPVAGPRSCPTSRPAGIAGDVRGGGLARRSPSSTAGGCASCSTRDGGDGAARAHRRDAQRGVPAAAALDAPTSCASGCRATAAAARERRAGSIADLDDDELLRAVRDLGGHDLGDLLDAFAEADAVIDRPSVVFAYTIKAWRLPTQGHPANHSALLIGRAVGAARRATSAPTPPTRGRASPRTRPRPSCAARGRAAAARASRRARGAPPPVPADVGRAHTGSASTQQAFGRFFVDLAHAAPEVAARVVTVSPDVASSTNLGGWINRVGIWYLGERIDWFADDTDTLVRWRESEHGQHIELGIAEGNLVGLLGELGATWSRDGAAAAADRHDLRPVRQPRAGAVVVRDVRRRRSRSSSARRRASRSRPRAARTSRSSTPSVGLEQPRCIGVGARVRPGPRVDAARTRSARLGRPDGTLGLLPADHAADRPGAGRRARGSGGARAAPPPGARRRISRCAGADGAPAVTLVGDGRDHARGPRRRRRAGGRGHRRATSSASPPPTSSSARCRRGSGLADGDDCDPRRAVPGRPRGADRHRARRPSAHAELPRRRSAATPIACLGVDDFGQSGDVDDLYRYFGIDADTSTAW